MSTYDWRTARGFGYGSFGAAVMMSRMAKVRMHHAGADGALTREALGALATWVYDWGVAHDLPVRLVPMGCPEGNDYDFDASRLASRRPEAGSSLPRIAVGLLLAECGYQKPPERIELDLAAAKKRAKGLADLFGELAQRPEASGLFRWRSRGGDEILWTAGHDEREAKKGEVALQLVPAGVGVGCALVVGVPAKRGAHERRGHDDWNGVFGKIWYDDIGGALKLTDATLAKAKAALADLGEPAVYLGATRV